MTLTWTKQSPVATGWYWYRATRSSRGVMWQVALEDVLMLTASGIPVDSFTGEWAGPIPYPDEEVAA